MKRILVIGLLLATGGVVSRAAAQAAGQGEGQTLYLKNCRQCHGTKGTPPKTAKAKYEHIADLSDAAFMGKRSEDSIVVVIKKGVKEEKEMKGFADSLSPEEMHLIAKYVRSLSIK